MRNLPAKLIPAMTTAYAALLLLIALTAAARAEAPGFVGSQSCQSCHQQQANAWSQSASRLGAQGALAANRARRFQRCALRAQGADVALLPEGRALFRRDRRRPTASLPSSRSNMPSASRRCSNIWWNSTAAGCRRSTSPGTPPPGAGSTFTPTRTSGAGNGLHWSGPYKNWQARCAVCHQTDFRKNFAPKPPGYNSQWSELSVGCEACHGPAEAHLAWAAQAAGKAGADMSKFSGVDAHGWQHPAATGKQAIETNMCGPCHSRREALGPDSSPPQAPFANHYNLVAAGGPALFPRRPAARRGLCARLVHAVEDVPEGRHLHQLPRSPFRPAGGGRQRRLHAMPQRDGPRGISDR